MLKLGEKIISDIYLGDKKIAKVFWGDKLVYQSGKPIFLDYVHFDGASYIDTGIKHQTCIVECDIRFEETGTRQLMGFGTGSGQYWGAGATGIFDYMSGTNALDRTLVVIDFNAEQINYTIYADGKSRTSANGSYLSSHTYRIGAGPTGVNSNGYWCTCDVWGNKFTNAEGELIQDLRPCIDPKGTVCFYDMVTGKYFYNQGTGTLKAGGRFVKSILFDGATYIDTGVKYQTCTVKTETKFSLTGTRQLMGFSGSSPIHYWGCNTSGNLDPLSSVSGLEFKEIEVAYNKDDVDNKTLTITVDGKSAVKAGKMDTTNSYLIGCLNTSSYFAQCEVKYNEIYVNGELIQDLRPYVDENGVACFKDIVGGGIFYNKGTGTLGYTE